MTGPMPVIVCFIGRIAPLATALLRFFIEIKNKHPFDNVNFVAELMIKGFNVFPIHLFVQDHLR